MNELGPSSFRLSVIGRPLSIQWLAVKSDSRSGRSWNVAGGHAFLGRLLRACLPSDANVDIFEELDLPIPSRWFRLEEKRDNDVNCWRISDEMVLLNDSTFSSDSAPGPMARALSTPLAPIIVGAGSYTESAACEAREFAQRFVDLPQSPFTLFVAYALPRKRSNTQTHDSSLQHLYGKISVLVVDSAIIRGAGWRVREDLSLDSQVTDVISFLDSALTSLIAPRFIVIRLRLDAMLIGEVEVRESSQPRLKSASLIYTHIGHDYLQRREQGLVYGAKSIVSTCIIKDICSIGIENLTHCKSILISAAKDAICRCIRLYRWGYPEWQPGVGQWERAIWQQTESLDSTKTCLEGVQFGKLHTGGRALLDSVKRLDIDIPECVELNLSAIKSTPTTWSITRRVIAHYGGISPDEEQNENSQNGRDSTYKLASQLLRRESDRFSGKDDGVPRIRIMQVGKLTALDRTDVDNICSVQRILRHYLEDLEWKTPMSLGVFGAPGSGKSFAVKELALNFKDQFADAIEEFNVAQWTSLGNMASAFHRVRDIRLGGKVPIVFFDEFDADFESRRFGWLKYFLMPMQDGRFQDRDGRHEIGRAVLVFAGGINHRFSEFSSRLRDLDFCDAKGPDFLSRLRGYYDVPSLSIDERDWGLAKLRRAWMLGLGKHRLSDEVRYAMLSVSRFRHGARSMKAILEMSNVNRATGLLDRSSLPRRDQLGLHVDYEEFVRLMMAYRE